LAEIEAGVLTSLFFAFGSFVSTISAVSSHAQSPQCGAAARQALFIDQFSELVA
jgi:hypothetical protein